VQANSEGTAAGDGAKDDQEEVQHMQQHGSEKYRNSETLMYNCLVLCSGACRCTKFAITCTA
jgi:hypothetical protein